MDQPDDRQVQPAGSDSSPAALADLAGSDPLAVISRDHNFDTGDAATDSETARAVGLAHINLGKHHEAVRLLQVAAKVGAMAGPAVQSRALTTLAVGIAYTGSAEEAIATAAKAVEIGDGIVAAHARAQLGGLQFHFGHHRDAIVTLTAAIAELAHHGDASQWPARAHMNRGLARVAIQDLDDGEADLRVAADLYAECDAPYAEATVVHNLGILAAERGDVREALDMLRRAENRFATVGSPTAEVLLDRTRVLLDAGLHRDAKTTADRALTNLPQTAAQRRAVARWLRAQANLGLGATVDAAEDISGALTDGGDAVSAIHRTRMTIALMRCRPPNDDRALHDLVRAAVNTGVPRYMIDAAEVMVSNGLADAATIGILAGAADGPPLDRAKALVLLATIDGVAGRRELALEKLDRAIATLAATEGTVANAEMGAARRAIAHEATSASLALTLESTNVDLERVFHLSELQRIGHTHASAPADVDVELRRLYRRRDDLTEGAVAEIEREIRDRELVRPSPAATSTVFGIGDLQRTLGGRVLVQLADAGTQLAAIVVTANSVDVDLMGSRAEIARSATHVASRLRRETMSRRGNSIERAVGAMATLPSIDVPPGDVVVSGPVDVLTLPWSLHPAFAGRAISLAPSATWWAETAGRRVAARGMAFGFGPDVPLAEEEAKAVAAIHNQDADRFTVDGLVDALGHRLVHVACHARQADNPSFSSLDLFDGSLFVHDLAKRDGPEVLVLSACTSLAAGVDDRFHRSGLAQAFIGLGARTVIGSITPLPDTPAVVEMMVRMHEYIADGTAPADALAAARAADPDELAVHLVACFGAGW